ncbi:MAG: efflux RND transporter periplasmic adaptor subunit, partial [Coleofasciculus sp. C2-GNP5-27]
MMTKKTLISTAAVGIIMIVLATIFFENVATDDHGEAVAKLSKGASHDKESHSKKHTDENEKDHSGEGVKEDKHNESEIKLTANQTKLAEIKSTPVLLGTINIERQLTGEVKLNQDLVAHVVPRLTGVVKSVRAGLGGDVNAGDVMVIVDSRELADAKAAFIAAYKRARIAKTKFNREERLWKKKISSEQDYLEAKIKYSEAQIEGRSAEQKLLALGYTAAQLKSILLQTKGAYTRYEVVAPFSGTVIEKHVTQGELVDQKQPLFRIANLDKVWVIASVYEKDVAGVK